MLYITPYSFAHQKYKPLYYILHAQSKTKPEYTFSLYLIASRILGETVFFVYMLLFFTQNIVQYFARTFHSFCAYNFLIVVLCWLQG